jgi:hypothetical protein
MTCFACGQGDRWIKTCRQTSGERVRVCDACWEALRLVIVPGDLCVTAKCRSCGVYGNPRDFTGLEKGEPLLGLCGDCAW